jgi:uncharacterized membrane protein
MADNQNSEQAGQSENGHDKTGLSRLLNKEILIPAAATAVTAAAAGLAATKGPDIKNKLTGEVKDGARELGREGAQGAKESITGGGGGALGSVAGAASKLIPGKGGGGGGKKTRRLPIQRWTDVSVPVEDAYDRWTNFEEYPKFMHRVLKVQQKEDDKIDWEEKIWFARRQWQGEIVEQRKNDRIAWKTVSGTQHKGVVSFHRLDDNLTRVLVTVDFQPTGLIEKMGSGLRFVKRAVQADLARFKAYAELDEIEGLEYSSKSSKDESQKDEKQKNEKQNDEGQSDEDRSEERRERDERRRERREALSSS